MQLAIFVTRAWEADTEQDTIEGICKLMNNLLDMTLLCPEMNLNEALIQFCKNTTSTQSVSPSITLLLAVDYISRLKQVLFIIVKEKCKTNSFLRNMAISKELKVADSDLF